MEIFGIDIGGSGVKGAPVDLRTGELTVERRHRIPTPRPATPDAVMKVAAEVVEHFDWSGPIGCAVPGVVQGGIVKTAANIDPSWIGTDGAALLSEMTGSRVVVLNDADAAGLAEVRYGAGVGHPGVLLALTFGTGIGSALFNRGELVPNTELGHLQFKDTIAEHYAAARLVEYEDGDLPIEVWAARVDEVLHHIHRLLFPDLFIFGGGISKRFDTFAPLFTVETPIVSATLRNEAGIAGAALAAARAFDLFR